MIDFDWNIAVARPMTQENVKLPLKVYRTHALRVLLGTGYVCKQFELQTKLSKIMNGIVRRHALLTLSA